MSTADVNESPIENELATYRALHPGAVLAVGLGTLSVLSFASPSFYVAAALAVVVGAWTLWRIRRDPEIFTGAGAARLGVVLGVCFGLSAFTKSMADGYVIRSEASKFGRAFASALANEDVKVAIWYRLQPAARKTLDPNSAYEKVKEGGPAGVFPEMAGPMLKMKSRVNASGAGVVFDRVVTTAVIGIEPVALVLLRFPAGNAGEVEDHGHSHDEKGGHPSHEAADEHAGHDHGDAKPVADQPPKDPKDPATEEAEQVINPETLFSQHNTPLDRDAFALITVKATREGRKLDWFVDRVQFPVEKDIRVTIESKGGGGGHGHEH